MKKIFEKYKYELLVVLFFVLIRLPSLGHDNFNTDVWKWKARAYDFGSGISSGQLGKTLQMYHPGVTLMWIGGVGVKINNIYSTVINKSLSADNDISVIFQLDFIQKFLIVSVIGFVLATVFYVLRNIFDLKFAFLAIFLLSFEPFYLALTRVFHLEGLVSTFMLASVVWLYYYFLDTNNTKRLVVSAVFGGFAVLTKTSAIFLIPFCGLTSIIYTFRNGKQVKEIIRAFSKTFFTWLFVVIATFFVFWPALWVEPVEVFKTLYQGIAQVGVEGDHIQYYFGKLVGNPGPTFYFVVLAFKSSVYLLLGFVGALIFRRKLAKEYRQFLDFLLIFIFFYFIQLIIPSKKLDRYLLPALVIMSLVSSVFFAWLFEKLKFNKVKIVLALLPVIFTFIYLQPDYFSYYNPLFGGLKVGAKVLEPKWLIGGNQIVNYFKKLQKEKGAVSSWGTSFEELVYTKHGAGLNKVLSVGFLEKYYTQIWPFFREFGAWPVIEDLTPFAMVTKYFVYPVWDDASLREVRFPLEYVDSIKLRGVPLYNVYINKATNVKPL